MKTFRWQSPRNEPVTSTGGDRRNTVALTPRPGTRPRIRILPLQIPPHFLYDSTRNVEEPGLLIGFLVHAANIQDRDGAPDVLKSIRYRFPWLRHIFADGGYAGPKLRGALERNGDWTVEIVKRSDTAKGFEVIPRRWVVERTFAWLGRCRRLAKDWEKSIASAEAWLLVAHIRLVTRRLARYCFVA